MNNSSTITQANMNTELADRTKSEVGQTSSDGQISAVKEK